MVLTGPLGLNAISLFKGIVDFYYWKGLLVARRWPTYRPRPPTEGQTRSQNALRQMHAEIREQDQQWHDLFEFYPLPLGRTYEDLKRKLVLWHINSGMSSVRPSIVSIKATQSPDGTYWVVKIICAWRYLFKASDWRWKYASVAQTGHVSSWITVANKRRRSGATCIVVTPPESQFKWCEAQVTSDTLMTYTLRCQSPYRPSWLWYYHVP